LEFRERIDTLRFQFNADTLDTEWSNFRDAYNSTALEVLGVQSCKRKEQITSQETKDLLEERHSLKQLQLTALNLLSLVADDL